MFHSQRKTWSDYQDQHWKHQMINTWITYISSIRQWITYDVIYSITISFAIGGVKCIIHVIITAMLVLIQPWISFVLWGANACSLEGGHQFLLQFMRAVLLCFQHAPVEKKLFPGQCKLPFLWPVFTMIWCTSTRLQSLPPCMLLQNCCNPREALLHPSLPSIPPSTMDHDSMDKKTHLTWTNISKATVSDSVHVYFATNCHICLAGLVWVVEVNSLSMIFESKSVESC